MRLSALPLDTSWRERLKDQFSQPYFNHLNAFIDNEYNQFTVFPKRDTIFQALNLTPFDAVKVVILGQDPYHDDNQAHGLAFSVQNGVRFPPSLVNIFKELQNDLGFEMPKEGDLSSWAKEGVLLLNTVLTVRAHEPHSHGSQGWETFTDAIIEKLSLEKEHLVFILWGKPAQAKKKLIDLEKHKVIESSHPSPLSSYRGFFGSKPFSETNVYLKGQGMTPINWKL